MRTRKLVLAFLVVIVSLLIAPVAGSEEIPERIEGVWEVKLCMKEEEFVSAVLPRLGSFKTRQISRLKMYEISPVRIIWPPGSGLIPSQIDVEIRDGLVAEIKVFYFPHHYPGRTLEVYEAVRRYILSTYPLGPLGPFRVVEGALRQDPYSFTIADKDGTLLMVGADPAMGGVWVDYSLWSERFIPRPPWIQPVCEGRP